MEKSVEEEKPETIPDLLAKGIAKIAQKPAFNPKEIPQHGPYALFLMEEDYPGLTPAMWNKVAEEFGFDFKIIMLVASPSHLPALLAAVRADNRIKGGVFGVGFKDEAVRFLDKKEPIVAVSQSANVFVKTAKGRIEGFNTDAAGFIRSLKEEMTRLGRGTLNDKKVVLLGAGGTGSAIAFLLASQVGDLLVLNRTVDKASDLVQKINKHYKKEVARFGGEEEIFSSLAEANIVINTTTKGASGAWSSYTAFTPAGGEWTQERNRKESERLLKGLVRKPLICDVVLTGGDTPTIALAKQFNLPTLDGRLMNLYQAIPAIKLVFEKVARVSDKDIEETMRKAQTEATAGASKTSAI